MPSYLGTKSGSSQPKQDEVKMVLYSRGVWNALFFISCYWRTDVYKNGRSPALSFFLFCFGRGTRVARRDQGGGLALPESCRGFCQSRYDAYNPKSAMKTVHHWRPTLMHLGCMIEKEYIYIYIYICIFWQHFFVDTNFIKHNRHFMST